jgi:hypothetical protein
MTDEYACGRVDPGLSVPVPQIDGASVRKAAPVVRGVEVLVVAPGVAGTRSDAQNAAVIREPICVGERIPSSMRSGVPSAPSTLLPQQNSALGAVNAQNRLAPPPLTCSTRAGSLTTWRFASGAVVEPAPASPFVKLLPQQMSSPEASVAHVELRPVVTATGTRSASWTVSVGLGRVSGSVRAPMPSTPFSGLPQHWMRGIPGVGSLRAQV